MTEKNLWYNYSLEVYKFSAIHNNIEGTLHKPRHFEHFRAPQMLLMQFWIARNLIIPDVTLLPKYLGSSKVVGGWTSLLTLPTTIPTKTKMKSSNRAQ